MKEEEIENTESVEEQPSFPEMAADFRSSCWYQETGEDE